MARAPAGKKSPKSESRSSTTTAPPAKGAKKTADDKLDKWTDDDQAAAAIQGWGLFDIVDEKQPTKVFYEVQERGVRFEGDEFARIFVAHQAKNGDALAMKAVRLVFRTKSAIPPKRKK